jgi:hypothetical protein
MPVHLPNCRASCVSLPVVVRLIPCNSISNYFVQISYNYLLLLLEINLLCYCRNLNTCPTITSLVKLQKSKLFCLVLLLIFCRKSPVNLCFLMVIFLFSSIGLTTTLHAAARWWKVWWRKVQPLYAGCGAVLSRSSCAGVIPKQLSQNLCKLLTSKF